MVYIFVLSCVAVLFGALLVRVFLTLRELKFYQKQGIAFTRTFPIFGSEVAVTDLIGKNKTRDYLYNAAEPADFIGCIRGFEIQLYGTNKVTTEALIKPSNIGRYIDRDTPALYSFGQLSPDALTFTPISAGKFHERKTSILRSFDLNRIGEISQRLAIDYNERHQRDRTFDMKKIVGDWTRDVMGEFVWGHEAMNRPVLYKDVAGKETHVNFMLALNSTFTRLRYYSNRFWNRVYFPIATWPVTKEARLLQYNIKRIQEHLGIELKRDAASGSVAECVMKSNEEFGIPLLITRDDLLTVSIAGLDTVQSMILASLWYILHPDNEKWKQAILRDGSNDVALHIVEACINEAIRLDPPGSVINNKVVEDFDLETGSNKYRLRKGTRVMPNIHALHAVYGDDFNPQRFMDAEGKKDLYVIPFGKGRRSCPGQMLGMLMAVNYVREFIVTNPTAYVVNATDEHIRFNNISRSKLTIATKVEPEKSRATVKADLASLTNACPSSRREPATEDEAV